MKHRHALRAEGTQARQHLGGPSGRDLGDRCGGGCFSEEVLLELGLEGQDE